MIKKSLFFNNAIWALKNTKFDSDFEDIEKVAKDSCEISYQRKSDRKTEFLAFCVQKCSAYNFLRVYFSIFFNGFELSIEFCVL